MEIWGELSLPSDPLALSDSNMFESIDDSEHDQYEDDLEVDVHNPVLNLDVCNAAKALESVLSEALGKYPLLILDDKKIGVESMENNRNQGRSTKSKVRRTISASLFGDCLESFDDNGNLLEIWEEDELDDEISSIEEEIERIQKQKYVNETSIPYSPRSESPCNTLFFEEYACDFLQEPEDVNDSSSDSSPLNSPLCSPPQSFSPPANENDNNCDIASSSSSTSCDDTRNGSDCKSVASSTAASSSSPAADALTISSKSSESNDQQEDKSLKKRTAESEKPNLREKRRRNNTKDCLSEASLSVSVHENSSSGSPSGKPPRRRKSKAKKKSPRKKDVEKIFGKTEIVNISSVEDNEVDVAVDIGDASDFINY